MNFLFTPPNTHYDNGLGITANNFSSAASILKENNSTMAGVLPLYYLQRHAIELFLKSLIVILHKKYSIPYGDSYSIENPALKVNDKWKPLSNTHNIDNLYQYFVKIYSECNSRLPDNTCWDLPSDLERKIKLISGSDPKSTYFRYPESSNPVQDSKKANIKKESMESIVNESEKSKKAFFSILMLDDNDEFIESYNVKSTSLPEVSKALEELNEFFIGIHCAFRVELTNGS